MKLICKTEHAVYNLKRPLKSLQLLATTFVRERNSVEADSYDLKYAEDLKIRQPSLRQFNQSFISQNLKISLNNGGGAVQPTSVVRNQTRVAVSKRFRTSAQIRSVLSTFVFRLLKRESSSFFVQRDGIQKRTTNRCKS